ncbi:MAG: hypothetical protein CMK59_06835 [Proteobacteria bacterium]|nr:hypothetical protein [Pseudomonadota bacterium]
MSPSVKLNQELLRLHPAACRALSRLGLDLFFPKGIPLQAAQAADTQWNATIGQCTDDDGQPMPLPIMARRLANMNSKEVFLYTPQGGRKDLRQAWKKHILREASLFDYDNVEMSLPVACSGLTHGLSIAAELFMDSETHVFLPRPRWGNYNLIFGVRVQPQQHNYELMTHQNGVLKLNIDDLVTQIKASVKSGAKKLVLVLNFPSNPTGYTLTKEEADRLAEALDGVFVDVSEDEEDHPVLTIVLDEAYHGMEWEDDCLRESLFFRLSKLNRRQFLICKVDGSTKEMFFFGGRIGFLTFATSPEAASILEEKVIGCIRSAISALSSVAQSLLVEALNSDDLYEQQAKNRDVLKERYEVMKSSLAGTHLVCWPFNSAFFVIIETSLDSEQVRLELLQKGVGVVSISSMNAIRISYSTVPASEIPQMVQIIEDTLKKHS